MTSTSLDESVTPVQYNYCDKEELEREEEEPHLMTGESRLRVFFR